MRREPGFAATALLTLSLGIGATAAVYSLVQALFLRPLPFADEARPDFVWLSDPSARGYERWEFSFPTLRDVRAQNRSFDSLSAARPGDAVLTGSGDAERLAVQRVSANFFETLGVPAAIGRGFAAGEDQPGGQFVAVLSHAYWQRRFGADPGLIGRTLTLDGASYTVIGVMPHGFDFRLRECDVWLPVLPAPFEAEDRSYSTLTVIGRRKAGVTSQAAQDDLHGLLRGLERQFPRNYKGWTARVIPVREQYYGSVRAPLLALLGAAGAVLAIGCVNVANLLLARGLGRRREFAIRAALGASRFALVRQLLTESLVLALLGGLPGLALAAWGGGALLALAPAEGFVLPVAVGVDGGVLAFALGVSALTAIGFGLAPALAFSGPDVGDALKDSERGSTRARGARSGGVLVALETALALTLAVGAALLIQTFVGLRRVSPGYVSQGVLTMRLLPATGGLSEDAPRVIAFWDELMRQVAALPGVESVGAINYLPGFIEMTGIRIENRPPRPPGQGLGAHFAVASPGYFQTMKIPLRHGRYLEERDGRDAPKVVVLGEAAAREFFPNGEDPIGQRLAMNVIANDFSVWHEIVGVVGDVRDEGLDRPPLPQVYWCSRQDPDPPMNLVVRPRTESTSLVPAIRARAREIRSDVPVFGVMTLDRRLGDSLWLQRLSSSVAAVFTGLALLLAAIGIYGVSACSVAARTREIGVRMALGATPGALLSMVVRQGMRPVLWGLLAGIGGAVAAARALAGFLYGIAPTDARSYLAAGALLALVAIASIALPALRAARVDPVVALRHD